MNLVFAIKKLAGAAGGAERVLCTIASELASRGHNITILTFDHPGGSPFYPLDTRVMRLDLGIGNSAGTARSVETLHRIWAARRAILSLRADVVIGFMHSMFVPLSFALVGTGIPVLGSEHIVPDHYRERRKEFFLVLASALFLKKITVLSATIRLRYPYLLRRKMVVVPNPVVAAISPPKTDEIRTGSTLLTVGRLDLQKDQATLIKAFARLAANYPAWTLRIVGEGNLRGSLSKMIDSFGLAQRIILVGVTPRIDTEYGRADVFALPSRYESFGLATAEAMSYGLPVIGFSDCPGTNELIRPGETGVLVDPGYDRVASMAEALATLMADPAMRQRLGDAARRSIDWKFSAEYVSGLWEDILTSLAR